MSYIEKLKHRFTGISWRAPAIQVVLPFIDAGDRAVTRLGVPFRLPPYSVRIRSTGVAGEFGGRKFIAGGEQIASQLECLANLSSDDEVLEIGCGAGRNAIALASRLDSGNYSGLDIDWPAIAACRANPLLAQHHFRFLLADIENDIYNPGGYETATTYRFPFDDASFDLVFLTSVFTHMLPDECANYAREIMRVLRPDGRCVVTTFLVDQGPGIIPFTRGDEAYFGFPNNPRKAVGYETGTIESWFGVPAQTIHLGTWHPSGKGDLQDFLVYHRLNVSS
jgi:SAM-dependent methyltransferase